MDRLPYALAVERDEMNKQGDDRKSEYGGDYTPHVTEQDQLDEQEKSRLRGRASEAAHRVKSSL